jgi:hypothetical protein
MAPDHTNYAYIRDAFLTLMRERQEKLDTENRREAEVELRHIRTMLAWTEAKIESQLLVDKLWATTTLK